MLSINWPVVLGKIFYAVPTHPRHGLNQLLRVMDGRKIHFRGICRKLKRAVVLITGRNQWLHLLIPECSSVRTVRNEKSYLRPNGWLQAYDVCWLVRNSWQRSIFKTDVLNPEYSIRPVTVFINGKVHGGHKWEKNWKNGENGEIFFAFVPPYVTAMLFTWLLKLRRSTGCLLISVPKFSRPTKIWQR